MSGNVEKAHGKYLAVVLGNPDQVRRTGESCWVVLCYRFLCVLELGFGVGVAGCPRRLKERLSAVRYERTTGICKVCLLFKFAWNPWVLNRDKTVQQSVRTRPKLEEPLLIREQSQFPTPWHQFEMMRHTDRSHSSHGKVNVALQDVTTQNFSVLVVTWRETTEKFQRGFML